VIQKSGGRRRQRSRPAPSARRTLHAIPRRPGAAATHAASRRQAPVGRRGTEDHTRRAKMREGGPVRPVVQHHPPPRRSQAPAYTHASAVQRGEANAVRLSLRLYAAKPHAPAVFRSDMVFHACRHARQPMLRHRFAARNVSPREAERPTDRNVEALNDQETCREENIPKARNRLSI